MLIHMLTGYTFCVPWKTKTASEVVQAYVDEVYAKFGGFKNQLFKDVATQLGMEHKVYSPPYHPQCNGRIVLTCIKIS